MKCRLKTVFAKTQNDRLDFTKESTFVHKINTVAK